jgi:hypothetical protein
MAGDPMSDKIMRCFRSSVFDRTTRDFAPKGSIDDVITRKSILMEMDVDDPTDDDELLVDNILEKAKKVFAIAVHIGLDGSNLRKAMASFKSNGFADKDLPISYTMRENAVNQPNDHAMDPSNTHQVVARSRSSASGTNIPASFDISRRPWNRGRIYNFFEAQWKFLAPVFSTDKFNHDLEPLCILPFVSKDSDIDKGSFGQVSKFEIHPDHFVDPKNPVRDSHYVK